MTPRVMKLVWTLSVMGAVSGTGWDVARATERHVPSDYPTVQAAIDAAVNGDIVVVADGTYTGAGNRDIDFAGKAITVRSEHGPANCIIDCEGSAQNKHRGFRFHTNETAASVLDGLTIQHGYAPLEATCNTTGGGILCRDGADPTIRNCLIRWNAAPAY